MTLTTTAIMAAVLMTTHWEEITYSQSAVEALLSSENNVIQDVKFHDFLLQITQLSGKIIWTKKLSKVYCWVPG